MMTTQSTKALSTDTLLFVRADLTDTLRLQETMARCGHRVENLGRYRDELLAVAAELRRRGIR